MDVWRETTIHSTRRLPILNIYNITNMDIKQVPLSRSQIKYLMNLMMGDYHSREARLYNHLESYLNDDMYTLERKAAKLEITVDELCNQMGIEGKRM